ncbi:MAG: TIGR00730 family Rossman fold protein, partial [Spirochaetes bacterium]|nr:TIGR00730 family Rossman fold protein [Spirochaetota bacterium]
GHGFLFGGGDVGLMGEAARAAKQAGARVTGVIVDFMNAEGVAYPGCDALKVTATMAERKALLEGMANAYVALPGGFGTLDELAQVITLAQLGLAEKPIALVNTAGFYDRLAGFFDQLFEKKFAKTASEGLYRFVATPAEALAYLEGWKPGPKVRKWF